jgi:hypothetical protein
MTSRRSSRWPAAFAVFALAMLCRPSLAWAQTRWKEIGRTSSGNSVYVDPRSIKHSGNLVSGTVRVVFKEPVQTAKGIWKSSRTALTFDCTKKSVAAKENVYYADERGTKVTDRKVNKQPGFGPVLGGSPGELALRAVCDGSR